MSKVYDLIMNKISDRDKRYDTFNTLTKKEVDELNELKVKFNLREDNDKYFVLTDETYGINFADRYGFKTISWEDLYS